uniref:Voltage-dependent anion-selective channel n=1 Tax=Caligus rogercresseyi TaxID=217165 RepID=C1BQN5_CALRO|nr:Voltage-dependent anion-selective channel [Caligus rogercresseyi]|eukprot:TRINITY_DN980_c0_g1_i1.p1 TRINITY_DN980_c0_g1~~TRINITY_DN980_c0_g1_i1.p1  ORF type:complete len:284 (-),score=143.56 TRINITY_DN980_c0_g1_i1:218-1069(-)
MSPPSYSDLGKNSRDVFSKGYLSGLFKLDCKTATESGVKFSFGGNMSSEGSKVSGNLEMKHTMKDCGLTFTEKWSTDNTLHATVDATDKVLQGLKLTLDSSYSPLNNEKKSKLKATLKQEKFTLTGDAGLLPAVSPLINASIVLGHQNWLGGAQIAFDSSKSKLTKNAFALDYCAKDFVLHTNINDGNVFGASLYQRVNPIMEAGVNVGYTSSSNASTFGVGLKYKLDQGSSVSAKVNNSGIVGLGFSHKLKDGIILNLSTLLNGKNLNEGGNKLSLGLELEA